MAEQKIMDTDCRLCKALTKADLVAARKILTNTDLYRCPGNTAVLLLIRYYKQYLREFARRNGLSLPDIWLNEGVGESRVLVFDLLKLMFKHGLLLNISLNEEMPLLAAVSTHDEPLIKLLCENGADPNMLTPVNKMNALALSIILNDAAILKLLLLYGGKVNAMCCQSLTPLQLAMNKSEAIFKLLFQNGADVEQVYRDRGPNSVCITNPPLMYAVESGNLYLTSILLEHGEDVNQCYGESQNTAIHSAIERYCNDTVRLLIRHGANINKRNGNGHTPLGLAIHLCVNQTDIIETLINAGCSLTKGSIINVFGKQYPPLHIAAFLGYKCLLDIIQMVIDKFSSVEYETTCSEKGQNPDRKTQLGIGLPSSSLGPAVDLDKQEDDSDYFINQQASDRSTVLFMAVLGGSVEIAEYLIQKGADPFITCRFGSLLHAAVLARKNPLPMVKFALQFKLDLDSLNEDGNTPLILSARNACFAVCNELLEHGANLNTQDGKYGETALSASVYFGFEQNAELLLRCGANPDIPDFRGTHALYWAIFNCRERSIELLLAVGAKLTKADLATYPKNIKVMKNATIKALLQNYVTQPRSLQQTCRLVVRKQLIEHCNGRTILPSVMSLPLPSRLKSYVAMTTSS